MAKVAREGGREGGWVGGGEKGGRVREERGVRAINWYGERERERERVREKEAEEINHAVSSLIFCIGGCAANEYAQKNGFLFFEVSAKTGDHVQVFFCVFFLCSSMFFFSVFLCVFGLSTHAALLALA